MKFMNYKPGDGLGKDGHGMKVPLPVGKPHKKKTGFGFVGWKKEWNDIQEAKFEEGLDRRFFTPKAYGTFEHNGKVYPGLGVFMSDYQNAIAPSAEPTWEKRMEGFEERSSSPQKPALLINLLQFDSLPVRVVLRVPPNNKAIATTYLSHMDRKSLIGLAKGLVVGLVIGTSSRPVFLQSCQATFITRGRTKASSNETDESITTHSGVVNQKGGFDHTPFFARYRFIS
uniref:G-patch domain-containing protein n=1 Tax=Ombrophytum subterraneum TaxID=50155 RepID=A0A6M8Q0K3_9MAGN|nr:hypothetical protein [Ombrophytum subterraneum]